MTISTSISFSSITISNISHLEVYRMAAPYNKKHWVLSQYALSSLSKQPNSRYWHKSSFRAFWVIQKCIFVTFEWSSMCHIVAKLFEPSCTITICIIKSIQETKLQILAQIVLIRTLDHSKLNDPYAKYDKYVDHIVNTMLNYQNMQFEVNPIDQTWENGQKLVKTGHFVPT